MNLPVVQSLWLGPRLSVMEQLAIKSFLGQGHPFHLYTVGRVENVPQGTTIVSASELFSCDGLRRLAGEASRPEARAAIACWFRFQLLAERGGWWTDLDNVCLRPLSFIDEHVLGFEREPDGRRRVGAGLIKAPVGSPLMQECRERCRAADPARLGTSEFGRQVLADALESVPAPVRLVEPSAFCPIDSWRVWQFILERQLPERCYAIRLWSAKWRRERLNPDVVYDLECLYEQLKRRFGVTSPDGANYGPGWTSLAKIRMRKLQVGMRRRQPMLRAA